MQEPSGHDGQPTATSAADAVITPAEVAPRSTQTSGQPPSKPEAIATPPVDGTTAFHIDYVPFNAPLLRAQDEGQAFSPIGKAAVAWVAGIVIASLCPITMLWLSAAIILSCAFLYCSIAGRSTQVAGMIAIFLVGGTWSLVHDRYVSPDHLSRFLTLDAQLAQLTGTIESPAIVTPTQRGTFAQFSYEAPATHFVINVHTVVIDGVHQPTQGRLVAKLRQAEPRLREGDRVLVTGWMQAIDGPSNPGEFDFRAMYADRDIDGRITMNVRGNCQVIEQASTFSGIHTLRSRITDGCSQSLRLGMEMHAVRIAFLDTLLLGRWSRDLDELSESFRRTGLTHVLAISGAHLTILMLLVWMVVQFFVRHPSRAAIIVLTVLLMYMMAVPWRVPIVRAGIMAALVCAGKVGGRQVRAIDMIALSAIIVFIWRPGDVFTPGAQLSFGVVAGLLVFTRGVSQWIHADPLMVTPVDEFRTHMVRRACDYVAVNLVAFLIAVPLVAYHFQFISPLSMFLSILALPVITAVIGLGYLKILAGLLFPSMGVILSGPLEWASDTMMGLVTHATRWPASTVALGSAPPAAWLVATLALVIAVMAGVFREHRKWLVFATSICLGWLIVPHHPRVGAVIDSLRSAPPMRINMFAVGDGSCFLIRIDGDDQSSRHTIMFDCGSLGFLDVGSRSIVPSLRSMNVNRIDTLIISHADMDHFCGVLDVIKEIRIGRVLVPPQLLKEAEAKADSAAAFLMQGLRERRLVIEPISRGWHETLGSAKARVLWPPADLQEKTANSSSIVLSLHVAGRRVMLNGDIDQIAIPQLLDTGDDLKADITDLPHHGSFVRASPLWFDAVKPRIVLQSSGRARLRADRWAKLLDDASITRLVTAQLGMVEVVIEEDGEMKWSSFRERPIAAELP